MTVPAVQGNNKRLVGNDLRVKPKFHDTLGWRYFDIIFQINVFNKDMRCRGRSGIGNFVKSIAGSPGCSDHFCKQTEGFCVTIFVKFLQCGKIQKISVRRLTGDFRI